MSLWLRRVFGRHEALRREKAETFSTPLFELFSRDPLRGMTPSQIRERVRDEALAPWSIRWRTPNRVEMTRGDDAISLIMQPGMATEEQFDAMTIRAMAQDPEKWHGVSYPGDVYAMRQLIDRL
jgi:hypothetical protein